MQKEGDSLILRAATGVLDEALRASLAAALREAPRRPLMLDCKECTDVGPQGLAMLLELGREHPDADITLAGLSRRAMLPMLQVGLAETWKICPALPASSGPRALIYATSECPEAGTLDIAGRMLVLRQLQSLRELGILDVIVEIPDGSRASELGASLLGADPLTARVVVIPSARPLGVEELARRAGLEDAERFLAIPACVAFAGQLDLEGLGQLELTSPAGIPNENLHLELRLPQSGPLPVRSTKGWACRVRDQESAHALACAALEGRAPGILVHAAEVKPGIWLARGARVAADAHLLPPVLIGSNARILSGAQVGPRAVIGESAVVDSRAVVSDAALAAQTILGEGTRLAFAHADARGMLNFSDHSHQVISDPLVLASRHVSKVAWSSRLLALLLLLCLALPWFLGAAIRRALGGGSVRALQTRRGPIHIGQSGSRLVDLLPPLWDVLNGRRDLVGIGEARVLEKALAQGKESLRPGAFDLSSALAPGASTATLLRMWRWYVAHKNHALDRELWRRRGLRGRPET